MTLTQNDLNSALLKEVNEAKSQIEFNSRILADIDDRNEQRYKYLAQETQSEDSRLESLIQGISDTVVKMQANFDQLNAKCASTRNAVGYCLRKVEEAAKADPRNTSLAQVLEAIKDLERKIS